MPELPEVETVKLGLNQHTLGWQIIGGEVLLAKVVITPDIPTELLPENFLLEDFLPEEVLSRDSTPNNFLKAITGLFIHNWQRRGKYLLAELKTSSPKSSAPKNKADFAGYLGVHLRMTGRLLWSDR